MKKLIFAILSTFLIATFINAQEKAFQLFDSEGKKISYKLMLKKAKKADIVLFGENHNDPISHWLQLELTKDFFKEYRENLILGAEMFESDDQIKLNEFLAGFIQEKDFEKEAKMWPNYKTDYKPLITFAKENNLHFVATNIPRRFANIVYRLGIDTLQYLPDASKQFIAPLPILYDTSLHCYKKISLMAEGHVSENLPKSQAIKDATMAYFIHLNFKDKTKFIHYNGSYHSKFHESIMWYLLQLDSDLNILTIEVHEQADLLKLDEDIIGNSDYFIVVDEDMTKTH